jgi:ATP-binding cassette subfamily F protein 3
MGSVEALADALEDYTGTILLVTHDRHLIDRVATRVLEIHDDVMLNHLSAARYWEARAARQEGVGVESVVGSGAAGTPAGREGSASGGRAGDPAGSPSRAGRAPAGAAKARPGKESAEEARRRRARLRAVEAAVLRAEKRLNEIDAELAEPDTYADRDVLNRLLDERGIVEGQLKREYAEWERLVDEAG